MTVLIEKRKKKMVQKLFDTSNNELDSSDDSQIYNSKKLVVAEKDVPNLFDHGLEQFVNPSSISFFLKLGLDTSWLKDDCENWQENINYQVCLNAVNNLPVVNDVAERGVKLMQEYNDLFTKDEDQKQFIIQILDDYRVRNIKNTKESLLKPWN